MAQSDGNVARSVWHGRLPIQVNKAEEDNENNPGGSLQSVFFEVARCSYLPILTTRLLAQGSSLDLNTSKEQDIWYDYQGIPLKWHYPIGLLFDLLQADSAEKIALPWNITAHHSNFPSDSLLHNPSADAAKDMFMSMIKEADYLMHGNIKKVMNLSKRDQTLLWDALLKDHYEDHRKINQQLIIHGSDILPRFLPLRLYLPKLSIVAQDLVPFRNDDDQPLSLAQALARVLPDISPVNKVIVPISHGITLPADTPVDWAFENLSFPDNFLHIVVTQQQ